MARLFWVCMLITGALLLPTSGRTQESLRTLTGMDREQMLDWSNPVLEFDLNIPPGASAAMLTLVADPGKALPAKGSMLVVSINDNPGVMVNPRPEAFNARIDLPAAHLQAGMNRVRIAFEGANESLCPAKTDGGWQVDLARSRFDLSISPNIASFETLEGWLSAGAWALDRVSISQGALDNRSYGAFGALITQGLAVRAGRVPLVVSPSRIAGVDFKARVDAVLAGPGIALRPGTRPVVEFQGRNAEEVLSMARLFAGRIIRLGGTRATPALLAQAEPVQSRRALDGIKTALAQPSWDARPFVNTVRAPHHGQTRLVVEMERPAWVSPDSTVLISVDGQKPFKKRLKNELNHFTIPMDRKSATVVRAFSIARQARPAAEDAHCVMPDEGTPLRLLSARIESNGYEAANGLSRFAIDGAPFTQNAGAGAAIVFATRSNTQLYAAWRAAARVALVSGAPLTAAWYGNAAEKAPEGSAIMVLGPRSQLAPQTIADLPQVFASGAAAGPGDYEGHYKKPRLTVARRAFAANADLPGGLGVAGWTQLQQQPVLILTGDSAGDFIPAMQAFADGPAINFFAGRVVRWRAGLVEINDIGAGTAPIAPSGQWPAILFLIAGISLSGLWIRMWQRMYANWRPV